MRQPTPRAVLLATWSAMLADPSTPRHDGDPQCGYYRTRKVKGGPWLPLTIACRQVLDEQGELVEPERLYGRLAGEPVEGEDLNRVWLWCQAVSRDEYLTLLATIRATPVMTHTTTRVDLSRAPVLPPAPRSLFDAQ